MKIFHERSAKLFNETCTVDFIIFVCLNFCDFGDFSRSLELMILEEFFSVIIRPNQLCNVNF